ncbi:hypothetical protein GW17_00020983 [Ensete ventricosum]|nr:hypothetical protein GW17_00020983 [Ensete ventricosum]
MGQETITLLEMVFTLSELCTRLRGPELEAANSNAAVLTQVAADVRKPTTTTTTTTFHPSPARRAATAAARRQLLAPQDGGGKSQIRCEWKVVFIVPVGTTACVVWCGYLC